MADGSRNPSGSQHAASLGRAASLSFPAMETSEIFIRLGIAALAGAALGLNRDLHGKPTGVRTLGLVGLASALIVIAVGSGEGDASRVMQGIVTGIGFLGAGVIIRSENGKHVHNLTTAACVWLTACIGAASAVGQWRLLAVGMIFTGLLLLFGGHFERWAHRYMPAPAEPETKPTDRSPS
jgi:putative Mg2+ transporter-C (MgtC) family protein